MEGSVHSQDWNDREHYSCTYLTRKIGFAAMGTAIKQDEMFRALLLAVSEPLVTFSDHEKLFPQ